MRNFNSHAIDRPLCARADASATLRGTIRGALSTLRTWRRRARTRSQLLTLNDHLLADIGVSRSDLAREAIKPFWQA